MTVQERLEFIRAGYTRAEIEEFEIAAEKPAGDAPKPEEKPAGDAPKPEEKPAGDAHKPEEKPEGDAPKPEEKPAGDSSAPAWANALQASIDKLVKVTQSRNAMFDDMGDAHDTVTNAEKALEKYLTGK